MLVQSVLNELAKQAYDRDDDVHGDIESYITLKLENVQFNLEEYTKKEFERMVKDAAIHEEKLWKEYLKK